jgi:hypothetical protein
LWVAVSLASLAALLILVLCVPLDMAAHLDVYGRPKFRMRLRWLFGLVSREIRKGEKKPEEKERVIKVERRPKKRRGTATAVFRILRTKGLLRQIKALLRGILSRLKIRELGADFRVGLDNPADTGLIFALLGPAIFFLSSSFPHRIRVQPSFDGEAVFEGYLYGAVRLQPIQLVMPFMGFAFSLATIRAAKALVLTKWKRRK